MIWYMMIWYHMIWYYMMLFKTFEACVRLAAGAFFLEKTHILKKWYFRFLRKNDFCVFCVKNTTFELLDHFNEYLHVFLINFHTGSCQNDSPMFKLWSFLAIGPRVFVPRGEETTGFLFPGHMKRMVHSPRTPLDSISKSLWYSLWYIYIYIITFTLTNS